MKRKGKGKEYPLGVGAMANAGKKKGDNKGKAQSLRDLIERRKRLIDSIE